MGLYYDYANGPAQKKVAEQLDKGITNASEIGRLLGISDRMARRHVSTIKARAAKKDRGEHIANTPEGFGIKKTSTMYGKDGEVAAQWVIRTQDQEKQLELMRQVLEELKAQIPREKISPACKNITLENLLNCYVVTDYHLGMLSWHEESGVNWNTEISEEFLERWFAYAIANAPNAHTAIFSEIGDWLHSDGLDAVTPTSGHPLDSDSRFQKMVRISIRLSRKIISMLLEKHEHVHVIMAEGNHNLAGSVWMREMFDELYRDEPRVTVDISADPYYCYEWGKTSLFWHHGHKRRPANIDHVFAAKFRDVFGRTKYSYAHMGHMHHIDMKETSLMVVEQHRTLAAPDAHASRGGYCSNRSSPVITYHKEYGEVGRQTISPEMIQS